jgi:methylation protein EvaC
MICKITGKEIKSFINFGKMPIANGFLDKSQFKNEFFFNMEAGFSEEISLFQLNDHPKPKDMFNEKYPFFSGSSKYMEKHFKLYSDYLKKLNNKSNLKIIEIGSNDGTMLKNFHGNNFKSIGFEPSKNVSDKAKSIGLNSINEFFNKDIIEDFKEFHSNTDIIYASNVICHIPDLNNLIECIDILLNKDGFFVFEEPYLGSMYEKTSYDQIYDEHIYMFSVISIKKIFELFNFKLVDVLPQITHGGSMRYIVKRKNQNFKSENLEKYLNIEKKNNLDNFEWCLKFKKNCEKSKLSLKNNLEKFKSQNLKICGYAATSKSTTILNYCKIGPHIIDFICDTTPEKIGKYSPGMHIPIVDMKTFQNEKPDAAYLFAWNHKNEILEKEKKYKGKWFSHVAL